MSRRRAGETGWQAHVQASAIFQSMSFAALRVRDIAALGNMPGYATFDFSAGVERDKTSVELFAKNAFDSRGQANRYSECPSCQSPGAGPFLPGVYVVPVQPLTVGLRLGEKF